MSNGRFARNLLRTVRTIFASFPSERRNFSFLALSPQTHSLPKPFSSSYLGRFRPVVGSTSVAVTLRFLSTNEDSSDRYETNEEGETTDGWEEEDEDVEPEFGDGGDGGGVVLQNLPWGDQVLSIAREVLLQFGDEMKLYAFKITPRGYIYVRLDKLSNLYGCPSIEELESYSQEYKKRLDEAGALKEIPDDLALEVSSPGAERLLKVPDDLNRFKDMPMRVCYVEDSERTSVEKDGVFLLDSVETESESCAWKLADVKENRDPLSKGRPFSRKQKDWRLKLPYTMFKRVTLYLE